MQDSAMNQNDAKGNANTMTYRVYGGMDTSLCLCSDKIISPSPPAILSISCGVAVSLAKTLASSGNNVSKGVSLLDEMPIMAERDLKWQRCRKPTVRPHSAVLSGFD